ncbi:MAG TPA: GAF domain-containing sensor histidine kinase [Solirubrobacteraceae bacterium]|nr:GAF domain-containing sensor histidine kinase [Solirubrobacteraceae bacterium]
MDRAAQRILEVARSVLSELDLDVVLDRVLDAAQELTEARYAALGVLNKDASELVRFITRGIDKTTHTAIGALPRGRGVLGVLIDEPQPLRLSDVEEHPRSYGFPPEHPPMKTFLGVPILIDGEPYGNLYLTEKAGGVEFSEDDEQAVVILAEYAAVAIDHARRYAGASERRDELERTVATLQATTEIARALGGETDPEVVLKLVAKRGRALVSARALLIELVHGEQLVIAAGAGELPVGVIGQRVALSNTVAAHAMRTRRPQHLEDELNRARFEEHGLGQFGVQAQAGIVVPLIFRGSTHGVLLALDRLRDGPTFTAQDERLLGAFATSAASAVATAQSVTSERHRQRLAAAEGERSRWARELHDETLQSLNALRLGLAAAGQTERSPTAKPVFAQSVAQLEDTIANLRALITDLRPASLDALGTKAAIETLAERNARDDLEIDISIELAYEQGQKSTRMIDELETALYRITQEALTNATKHGQATRIVVEIHEDPTTVHLTVRDNGDGFDPDAQSDGFGLLGIHERTELLNGELEINSTPGKGTTLNVRLPVRRRAEDTTGTRSKAGQFSAAADT